MKLISSCQLKAPLLSIVTPSPHQPKRFHEKFLLTWTYLNGIKAEQWIHTYCMLQRLPTMSITFGGGSEMNNRATLWGQFFSFSDPCLSACDIMKAHIVERSLLSKRSQTRGGENPPSDSVVCWTSRTPLRLLCSTSASCSHLFSSARWRWKFPLHTPNPREPALLLLLRLAENVYLGWGPDTDDDTKMFFSLWKLPAAAAFLNRGQRPSSCANNNRKIREKSLPASYHRMSGAYNLICTARVKLILVSS